MSFMNDNVRPRRLRSSEVLRDMVREVRLSPKSLIYPLFLKEGTNIKSEISSLPNNFHYSPDRIGEAVEEALKNDVRSVLLFGIPEHKDEVGSQAYAEEGIVQQGIRKIK